MKLGYVIFYVPDVEAAISFYEKAFGLKRRFVDASGYGELETGATALGFASEALSENNGVRFRPSRPGDAESPAAEVAFVVDDPRSAFDRAVRAGAAPVKEPSDKPWGQTVAFALPQLRPKRADSRLTCPWTSISSGMHDAPNRHNIIS